MTGNDGRSHDIGPLHGVKIVEFAGLGAAPFAGTLLADGGADVIRIGRQPPPTDVGPTTRGRAHLQLNLKNPDELSIALDLIERADVLIEAFRAGVMERLDLGPERCLQLNPGLVYARMTGWGLSGPRALQAGHDINYLAITGALRSIARRGEAPVPPLNLVGDYGGGMMLAFGIMTALHARSSSGRGQMVDAAMVDAISLLMTGIWNRRASGRWSDEPGTNDIDTGAPFYDVYRTFDGEYMAVGSYEPQFWARLLEGLGLDPASLPEQWDREHWPDMKRQIASVFATRTRASWTEQFTGIDACVTPVLSMSEALGDEQLLARNTLMMSEAGPMPAPAPRLADTPLHPRGRASIEQAFARWGIPASPVAGRGARERDDEH
jgi:alpha-methylacyl-CoA racemase